MTPRDLVCARCWRDFFNTEAFEKCCTCDHLRRTTSTEASKQPCHQRDQRTLTALVWHIRSFIRLVDARRQGHYVFCPVPDQSVHARRKRLLPDISATLQTGSGWRASLFSTLDGIRRRRLKYVTASPCDRRQQRSSDDAA